jgi:DNA-binding beta-propeller fold protein YncE
MKKNQNKIHSRSSLSRMRIVVAGTLVLGAAALAATSLRPPRLPWAVPIIPVGGNPVGVAVDTATHTVYVSNGFDATVSVIDTGRCNSRNSSGCVAVATLTLGASALYLILDPTTDTIYADGFDNTIAVINAATCNATNTSGCGQTPATVTLSDLPMGLALDTATHTLYVGYGDEAPVSIIDTSICNATNTSGCGQTPVQTSAGGDTIAIDHINHGVYVSSFNENLIRIFNGATCNAGDTSGCGQPPATVVANFNPTQAAVDEATHSVYVPVTSAALGSVLMIDGSHCNGTDNSGCGNTPNSAPVGNFPAYVLIDPATHTVYVESEESSEISVINGATCNATTTAGCANIFPALAIGFNSIFMDLDPTTHTLYTTSQDTNDVWVLDASKCNATHTSGCTKFEPTTTVGAGPVEVQENPNTRTLYETNQVDNTVSVIDTTICNQRNLSGCNHSWPAVPVGTTSRHIGINKVTNTIYVSNQDDNTLSIINGATCNRSVTSGCSQTPPTTAVGNKPFQIAVDEMTNTIYAVNRNDGTVSVIDGTHCQGTDTSGCNQSWPTAPVGQSPQALTFNPNDRTLYVTNTNDDTVSVINGNTCNRINHSGCTPVATVPAGAAPRAIGVLLDRNTVFVGNRDDLTVSVFDGATCNGTNTSGCPQVPPPAVLVGAFPDTGGNGNNFLGRSIAIDQRSHLVFVPVIGDSDVATLDATVCRVGHLDACHVKIVKERMGGYSVMATVDPLTQTVYVANDTDGTVSLFGE